MLVGYIWDIHVLVTITCFSLYSSMLFPKARYTCLWLQHELHKCNKISGFQNQNISQYFDLEQILTLSQIPIRFVLFFEFLFFSLLLFLFLILIFLVFYMLQVLPFCIIIHYNTISFFHAVATTTIPLHAALEAVWAKLCRTSHIASVSTAGQIGLFNIRFYTEQTYILCRLRVSPCQ